MTKQERDNKIYEWIDVLDDDLETVLYKARVLKKGIDWEEWLLPHERRKYESLSTIEQLMIAMSCDPLNALNDKK